MRKLKEIWLGLDIINRIILISGILACIWFVVKGRGLYGAALVVLILCIFPASSSQTVYLTESGRCYHKRDCQYVIGKDNTVTVTEQQAKDSGYDACTWCFGHSSS